MKCNRLRRNLCDLSFLFPHPTVRHLANKQGSGQVENRIFLYVQKYNFSIQAAFDNVFDEILASYNNFCAAEERLKQHGVFAKYPDAKVYVDGYMDVVTRVAYWRYGS